MKSSKVNTAALSLTPAFMRANMPDMLTAINTSVEQYGVAFDLISGRVNGLDGQIKLKIRLIDRSNEAFARDAAVLGFNPEWLGRTVINSQGDKFVIIGLDLGKPKFAVQTTMPAQGNKRVNLTSEFVQRYLSEQDAAAVKATKTSKRKQAADDGDMLDQIAAAADEAKAAKRKPTGKAPMTAKQKKEFAAKMKAARAAKQEEAKPAKKVRRAKTTAAAAPGMSRAEKRAKAERAAKRLARKEAKLAAERKATRAARKAESAKPAKRARGLRSPAPVIPRRGRSPKTAASLATKVVKREAATGGRRRRMA